MGQSQSKDIKSFFGTLVAHGNPRAHSQLGRSTLQSASKLDTGLNAIGTTLQLTKDAGEAVSHVPYVKAVAGVLSQIIRIRDEIQINKERCGEIIELVQRKSTTILQSLDKVYEAKGAVGLEDLRSDLEAYADFLRAVLREELEPFKTQSHWTSYINRGKNAGDLQRLDRELEDFKDRFSMKRLVEISVAILSQPAPPAKSIPQALPPCPKLVIGRDSVVEPIVQVAISSTEPRVAILGPGGIGKTTIGLTVLHDPQIISAYTTRYFVSSELAPTTEILVTRVADTLSIPQSDRGTDLVSQIVDRIRRNPDPVFLYIDNLETVWEVEEEQQKVDRFLEVLSGASSTLAILITMRGTQKPKTSFPWDASVLLGLELPSSIKMYEELSKKPVDAPTRELLLKLGGIPLAIKLLASMVEEGDDPAQLLEAWLKDGPKSLEIGGTHRLSSLEQSIRLSVFSPRIDDTGRHVLGLIALLPDGLSTSAPWFERFESVLPDETFLQSTLRTLRRAALLEKKESSRWQMLPPIRQFCLHLTNSKSSAVASLARLYIATINEHQNYASPASQAIILPEMANIRSILRHSPNLHPLPFLTGQAVMGYAGWATWKNIDESIFLSSFLHLPIPSHEQANMYWSLGSVHFRWGRLGSAEAPFTRALGLYLEIQDRWGEANTHISIGELHMRRDQPDLAEASFTRALELYREIQNRRGEANTHKSLGNLYVRRDRLEAAEKSFLRALELCRMIQDPLGEAHIHQSFGDLLMHRGQLIGAESSFDRALELYYMVQDPSGEANTLKSIGDLHVRQDQLDTAESSFSRALAFYCEVQDRLGEANTLTSIGDLYIRRDNLDAAEESFTRALKLYHNIQHRLGEANTHKFIGDLFMRRYQLDAAEVSFKCALELYYVTRNQAGEADTHISMGDLYMHKDQLDAAEASLTRALEFYHGTQYRWGEAATHEYIGDLHMRQDELDAAETSYTCALALYREIHDQTGEARIHLCVGGVYIRRDQLHEAKLAITRALGRFNETKVQRGIAACTFLLGQVSSRNKELEAADTTFSKALDCWKVIGDNLCVAETYQAMGDLRLQRKQLDDAEIYLSLAMEIYTTQVQSRRNEAMTSRSIGELHLSQGQLKTSEDAFRRALELDIASSSRIGQGQSHRCLGDMFMKKGDLSLAEGAYSDALRLFLEIKDYQMAPCLLDLGKVWAQQGKLSEREALDAGVAT